MSSRVPKWLQQTLVVVAAVAVTAVAVRATDQVATTNWLASVGDSGETCAEYEVPLVLAGARVCLDAYEASAGSNCPLSDVTSGRDHETNLGVTGCAAATEPNTMPLRFASYSQASQYCAQADKRLPTAKEWHQAAEAMGEQTGCNVAGRPPVVQETGAGTCASAAGVHDLVGNVWEWVDAEVGNNTYNGREIPPEGFVQLVDTAGVVVETSATSSNATFDDAYAWVREGEVGGIVKGGFYGSGSDAGRYAQQVGLSLDTQTAGIGFRCVRDLL